MKISISLKDPDGFSECVDDAVKASLDVLPGISDEEREALFDKRRDSVWEKLGKWVEYQEYVSLEFDTDAGTATVVERK